MICYNCTKVHNCPIFRKLYTMSNDFCINDCKDYDKASDDRYKKIADDDDLMRLLYDYFMGQIKEEDYTDDIVKAAVRNRLMNM